MIISRYHTKRNKGFAPPTDLTNEQTQNMRKGFDPLPSEASIHGKRGKKNDFPDDEPDPNVTTDAGVDGYDNDEPQIREDQVRGVLRRTLTPLHGISIIVGIIIGSGIFSSVGLTLSRSGSVGAAICAWIFSGILVMLNAQVYCELGAMIPTTGGDYDYLMRAYGSQAAFSFAWFNFFVSKTGSQAIIATVFGRYLQAAIFTDDMFRGAELRGGETVTAKLAAVGSIIVLTAINCAGIEESAMVQQLLTGLKLVLVLILFLAAMAYADKDPSIITHNLSLHTAFVGTKDITHFGSALVACLWSYDGYCDLNFLMEELKDPVVQLPRVVLISLAIVTTAYALANVSYFAVLDADAIILSKSVAVDMGYKVGGTAVAALFALGVVVSTAGSNNGSIMTGGRAFYAVARGGHAPSWLARLNVMGAPYTALLAQGAWTLVLLILPGSSFSSLLDYFGPASWFFYAVTSSALIVLRYKEPHTVRPYKTPFYPLPPLMVILIAAMVIVSSLLREPLYCSLAFGFVALSIPMHYAMENYSVGFGEENETHVLNRAGASAGGGGGAAALATQETQEEDEGVQHNNI